jgi:hypothetical protein
VTLPQGGPTLVSVSAYIPGDIDDQDRPVGKPWALWELQRRGRDTQLVPRNKPDGSLALVLTGAMKLPNDERPMPGFLI